MKKCFTHSHGKIYWNGLFEEINEKMVWAKNVFISKVSEVHFKIGHLF